MNSGYSDSFINVSDLCFAYKETEGLVLQNVNLEVKSGERLGLLGPSGSGKTTFLKLISGLLVPQRGEIRIEGEKVERNSLKQSRNLSKKIAMSFQKGGLLDSFTAWRNIDFALRELTTLQASERRDLAFESLEQVGLGSARNKELKELSGGMLKRLSLARVFALKPAVMVLDDPTAGLDPVTSGEIVQFILKATENHLGVVLFASSDLAVSFELANRLTFLWRANLSQKEEVNDFKINKEPAIQQFLRGDVVGPLTEWVYVRT